MKRNTGRLKIRNVWFISFLAVLAVPMISAVLIYHFSLEAMEQQTRDTNRAYLQLMAQTMERAVSGVDQIADTLAVSPDFAFVRHIGPDMTAAQRYRIYDFSRNLFRYIVPDDPFILRRYVYLRNSGLILDGSTYRSVPRAYSSYFDGLSLSDAAYQALLGRPHARTYRALSLGPTRVVLCLRSLPGAQASFDSTVLVMVSQQAVLDVLTGTDWNRAGIICVLDQEGQLLLSSAESRVTPELLAQAENETELRLDGERWLCLTSESRQSGLKYLCFAPYRTLYHKVSLLQSLSALSILSGLAAGVLLALTLTHRNYAPVKRILTRLSLPAAPGNEYDSILDSIQQGQDAQTTLKTQLEEKQRQLGREQLALFLTGHLSWGPSALRMLEGHHMALNRAAYAVVLMDAAEFHSDGGDNVAHNVAEVLRALLERQLPGVTCYHTLADRNAALVAGMEPAQAAALPEALNAVCRELTAAYHLNPTVGLSDTAGEPARLPEMYRQAAAALEYAQSYGDAPLVCYPTRSGGQPYAYPIEQEMLLIQAVRDGQEAQAMKILDDVRDSFAGSLDVSLLQCLRMDLTASCLRVFAYADSVMTRDCWQGEGAARQLLAAGSLRELDAAIRPVLCRLCRAMRAWRDREKENLSGQVIQYVQAHWQEEGLSVAAIAGAMELHPSYVSRLFKEEQGVGLLEYINRFRVERAMVMLRTPRCSVTRAARDCGFASDASFIRVFKQYRGMTPGAYRDEYGVKDTNSP